VVLCTERMLGSGGGWRPCLSLDYEAMSAGSPYPRTVKNNGKVCALW
jgi:hypothetical protein